jgi:hypothetical protein
MAVKTGETEVWPAWQAEPVEAAMAGTRARMLPTGPQPRQPAGALIP